MRTVDATLLDGLQNGKGTPYLKAYVGSNTGTVIHSYTGIFRYRLTGTVLEFWIPSHSDFIGSQECIWLERGLTIAGTTYTITTGRFYIWTEEYLPDGTAHFRAGIVPQDYYSDTLTTDDYETVIDAFFTAFGKTTTYKDDTEAWLAYQFMPDNTTLILSDATRMLDLLQQKRLIKVCDNGAEDVRIYSADVLGSSLATVAMTADYRLFTSTVQRRQYVWRDELDATHTDGTATDPIHNLGFLKSTASPPARNTLTFGLEFYTRPDLRFQDGDTLRFTFDSGASAITVFAQVTEEFDPDSKVLPTWRIKLEANPIFSNSEGSPLPVTVAGSGNYIPVNTSRFDGVLGQYDTNLQTALDILDDHHPGGYVREKLGADRTIYVRKEVGSCTISNASPCVVTKTGHGLQDDDPIVFRTTGSLPTGLSIGTVYYVNAIDADTFHVAATPDGASINTSSAGSGTHYVATGSDSNDGTAQDRAHALLTLQAAIEIAAELDLGNYDVTIQLADSYYLITTDVLFKSAAGAGDIIIQGNASTPANVTLSSSISSSGYLFKSVAVNTRYYIQDLKVISTNSTFSAIWAQFAYVGFSGVTFGSGFSFCHIAVVDLGECEATGNYAIDASCARHWVCAGGIIRTYGRTITITNTPAWSSYFAEVWRPGFVYCANMTFTGSATGARYSVYLNGVIDTGGGGAIYLPGNAAGSTATGGQYT